MCVYICIYTCTHCNTAVFSTPGLRTRILRVEFPGG